jgi:hypothetical protein
MIAKWISKHPPIYVWDADTWYNEIDKKEYTADVKDLSWKCEDCRVAFPPKTKLMKDKARKLNA